MTSCMKRESKVHLSQFLYLPTQFVHTADPTSSSIERTVREASASREHEKIAKIVKQLCDEYAYAVHQPHARNGGLIGLAAASIALGSVCHRILFNDGGF